MVAGRNDNALAEALRLLAGSLNQMPQANPIQQGGGDDGFRALGKFQKNNPPTFKGEHAPEEAQEWLKAIEKIFRVMNCTDAQKVQFGTHMLVKEAEDWWINASQRYDEVNTVVTWAIFRDAFLENYFPEDVRGKKEVEFLELKQENGSVAEYAAKFQELIKYYPHYSTANAEKSKCLKFVNGLRPNVKKAIRYQQITCFSELVNKSRIYDEDSRECSAYYKNLHERKGKGQMRPKPYEGKGKQPIGGGKNPSGGMTTPIKCFKCGKEGHRALECRQRIVKCFKCDKVGHKVMDCQVVSVVTCYNCGERGHISTKCTKPKKETEKVFALSGAETSSDERLIRGTEDDSARRTG